MGLEPTTADAGTEEVSIELPTSIESPPLHNGKPSNRASARKSWTIEQSEELYRIRGWGEPYFSINAAGHVTVSPKGDRGGSLDLCELVEALEQRNLGLPLLIRFSDILEDRIERLNACFAKAISNSGLEPASKPN